MKILFLDDERNPKDVTWVNYPEGTEFTVVRTRDAYIEELVKNISKYDYISFDHDISDWDSLAYHENTGYDCVKDLTDFIMSNDIKKFPEVFVHSMNPIGADNIRAWWENFKRCYKDD